MAETRLTLTDDQITAINAYFQAEYIPKPKDVEQHPQLYFGGPGDESIDIRSGREFGGHVERTITPATLSNPVGVCYTDVDEVKINADCEPLDSTPRQDAHKITAEEVRIFMAAVRPSELGPDHKSLLTDSRVATVRASLGLTSSAEPSPHDNEGVEKRLPSHMRSEPATKNYGNGGVK